MSATQTDVYAQKMSPFIDDLIYAYDHSVLIKISERFGIQSAQVIHLLNLQTGRSNHSLNVVQIQPKSFLFLCFCRKDCDCVIQ